MHNKELIYAGLEFKSTTLINFLYRLDDEIHAMESHITYLEKELTESKKEINLMHHNEFEKTNKLMVDILNATLDVPKAETVGPVGAVVLANIMSMNPNEEIINYIKSIANTVKRE